MRTSWNIDDEVLREVKEYAEARSIPADEAASLLIRRGFRAKIGMRQENGVFVFDIPANSPTVTCEHGQKLIDEL
jgi:hypothetical protein